MTARDKKIHEAYTETLHLHREMSHVAREFRSEPSPHKVKGKVKSAVAAFQKAHKTLLKHKDTK